MKKNINIALVGNPNSGKSSLFNALTGLNQQVGNFPGVTVDKKTGQCHIGENLTATLIDLPGTYSLYPKRSDEWVAYKVLLQQDEDIKPDMVLLVADASNLKRNLLFCSQIIDLKIPVVMALSMTDLANKKGTEIDISGLERELGVPVVNINPRKNKGLPPLKKVIEQTFNANFTAPREFIDNSSLSEKPIEELKSKLLGYKPYSNTRLSEKTASFFILLSGFAATKTIHRYFKPVTTKFVLEPLYSKMSSSGFVH